MTDFILCGILFALALRDFIDNTALRHCAHELKRIAKAAERSAEAAEEKGRQ